MSELVALCNALEQAMQPLPALAGGLQQRAARLQSLAMEIQQAAREVPDGPDCSRVAAALYEAKHGLERSANALEAAVQQGRSYIQRTVGGMQGNSAASGGKESVGSEEPAFSDGALAAVLGNIRDRHGRGLNLVHIDEFDFDDNPVLDYRASGPPKDIAYAVRMWDEQIAPGLVTGATREDFAAYDREHGLEGHRSLAGVYDYMLGDDAIWSGGHRPSGRLDVGGGRHRLEQARLNGVNWVPARLR